MNKIWLIGASEGIGRALAIELSKEENNFMILSARNEDRLNELSKELGKENLCVSLNVCDEESILTAWNKIKKQCKTIDTFIYCAGYYKPMSCISMETEEIEKMIEVNLTGAIRALSFIIPQFIEQKKGHIILIGSIAGYRGLPNSIGYGSSKAGLIHLAENLKCDLSNNNIKIQVINPGFVKTRLTALNNFYMPSIMTAEDAAKEIIKNMNKNQFESRFPFLFANFLKIISTLPYWLYFLITKNIKKI